MRANLIILSKIKDEVGGFSIEIPRFNVFFFIFFAYRCQIPADISSSICLALSLLLLGIIICRITQCSGLPLPTFFMCSMYWSCSARTTSYTIYLCHEEKSTLYEQKY